MPLLRYSLYAQNVNLWLAPTADFRDTWEALMRTVGCEGRCFVISANQCQRRSDLPDWITGVNNHGASSEQGSGRPKERPQYTMSRRKSSAMRTEENHEIALPVKADQVNGDTAVTESVTSPPLFEAEEDDIVSRGGSCIVSPLGQTLAGPVWDQTDELLVAEVDFEDCARGKLDFDAAGHYSRPDAFQLTVTGLDLNPPA